MSKRSNENNSTRFKIKRKRPISAEIVDDNSDEEGQIHSDQRPSSPHSDRTERSESPSDRAVAGTSRQNAPAIDPALLQAIKIQKNQINGGSIFKDVVSIWDKILRNGHESNYELKNKYKIAKNLPMSRAPSLNPGLRKIRGINIKLDSELKEKQNYLGHALAALGKAITGVSYNFETMSKTDVFNTLLDVGCLISDVHYQDTENRRKIIRNKVDSLEVRRSTQRGVYLFGDDPLEDTSSRSYGIIRSSVPRP